MLGTPRCTGAGSAHLGQATTSGTSPLARQGQGERGWGLRPAGEQAGSNETRGGGRRSVQSLEIFLFWEGGERGKFPVGKKGIPAFSRAECWKIHLCRARLISVDEPDPERPTPPRCSFLEAPRLMVRMKPGSRLAASGSLTNGLFLSPLECPGHYERPHHSPVLIEPLMNDIGTAHRRSHRIPPWSPSPSPRGHTRCQVYFTQ